MSAQQITIGNKPMDQLAETQSLANSDNRLLPAQNMSEEEFLEAEKKLRRKLDSRLLLTMWLIFVLNYLDRVSTWGTFHGSVDYLGWGAEAAASNFESTRADV